MKPGLVARGDEVAGLNATCLRGLSFGLFPPGRGEAGNVFVGEGGFMTLRRLEDGGLLAASANETFGVRGGGFDGIVAVLPPFVVMAIAGLKVGDFIRISIISTDGCREVSSGSGDNLEAIESPRSRLGKKLRGPGLVTPGVVNSPMKEVTSSLFPVLLIRTRFAPTSSSDSAYPEIMRMGASIRLEIELSRTTVGKLALRKAVDAMGRRGGTMAN